jgi:hypothetical protein
MLSGIDVKENRMYTRTALLFVLALLAACSAEKSEVPASAGPEASPTDDMATPPVFARSPSPPGARVYFVTPADGAVVSSPVRLEFGVDGMQVVPAGTEAENSGHHHVIVDSDLPAMDAPIPADATHLHFGDGSTATELELPPGEHTLQLLFADHLHIPHQSPVASEPITITVE